MFVLINNRIIIKTEDVKYVDILEFTNENGLRYKLTIYTPDGTINGGHIYSLEKDAFEKMKSIVVTLNSDSTEKVIVF